MTNTHLSNIPDCIQDVGLDEATIEPFTEAAWFGWRDIDRWDDISNGLWWRDDGQRVVSLATGTDLHSWDGVDWELYPVKLKDGDIADDICCHDSRTEAEHCALVFLIEGRFCRQETQ